MAKNHKIKLVKLLTEDGKILDKPGKMDFKNGVTDLDNNDYPAGFDAQGMVYGTHGDGTGKVLFSDGEDTGYRLEEVYLSLVSLRVVHRQIIHYETETKNFKQN